LLVPLGWIYGALARRRARAWRGRARRLPRPVLSVGNLTFGGTGKTPFVIHAVQTLGKRGLRVAILSRGYRAHGDEGNDEAQVIALHLPGVPHLQDPDRFASGSSIADRVDCFVLDDGFQHHPLYRDADVVLVDATDPFGGGACPPAGRLREPLDALARATLVVITRVDLVSREALGETMRVVRAHTAAPVATGAFSATSTEPLEGRAVLVACGIGNPRAFRRTVEGLGARVEAERFYRDHHRYTSADAAWLGARGLPVVVTEKDAVKLEPLWGGPAPLVTVPIRFEPRDGAADIDRVWGRLCESSDASA
jgi:tetraacyldisaccharide 4'-kinase